MAFGVNKQELRLWKEEVKKGSIAFLTHYWLDNRFPNCDTVTKVGCNDMEKLLAWGSDYGLRKEWIDHHKYYPHFDLFGDIQRIILLNESQWVHLERFKIIRSAY